MINLTAMGQLRNANKILKVSDLGIHECRRNMDKSGRVCKDMDSSDNKRPVMSSLKHNNDCRIHERHGIPLTSLVATSLSIMSLYHRLSYFVLFPSLATTRTMLKRFQMVVTALHNNGAIN
jgi:hypothetical protein